ncbi:hypothetical protein V1502_16250 [Bacillus sp. SCS-153A]|uniref:hypothetical protein n=1 Tax=Rossellomorea sedimentorum TaxID=3115294 RepID=UPI003906D289
MNRSLENLKKAMDETTHKGNHFTEIQERKIKAAIHSGSKTNQNPNRFMIFTLSAAAITVMLVLISAQLLPGHGNNPNSSPASPVEWEVRDRYVEDGVQKFTVFPEPELTAGKPAGYLFSFGEPYKTYEGKMLSIDAYNQTTGDRINVVTPTEVTEPSPGYSSLQRFTARFEIPYGGMWKYVVLLDGEYYGEVVLAVNEEQEISFPEDIPAFVERQDFETIDWQRKAVNFNGGIIGNENKSGVIGADMPSLTPQKWMWHLWGNQSSELTVVAFHRETKKVDSILNTGWTLELGGENNGADAHAPSAVTIPEPGEWAILLYDGEKLFDVLVFHIKE